VGSGSNIPQHSAETIEMVCKALADAVTGPQIPSLIARLKPRYDTDGATKWKRLFNAVVDAQNRQQDGQPLAWLVRQVMQPVRFASTESFGTTKAVVNERLLLSGLEVRDDGKVYRVNRAATLDEAKQRASALKAGLERRGVHEDVLRFCRAELLQENYFHAVLEASKSVADKLRARTGLSGDGAELVDRACGIKGGPILAFNTLQTDWELSEQSGLAMLAKGLFGCFRNVTAHAPRLLWATSQEEALDMLTLASMLHRRLDASAVSRPA
jgi:uncharacterized protein (TIGR02391 family)